MGRLLRILISLAALLLVSCQEARLSVNEPLESETHVSSFYESLFGDEAEEQSAHLDSYRAKVLAQRQAQESLVRESQLCREKMDEVKLGSSYPGAPKLESNRALLLARAKAEPVLFLEVPGFTGEVSRGTAARRAHLLKSAFPRDVLKSTLATFRDNPERLRELFLRDGYVYTDDPKAAHFLTMQLTLEKLFREPALVLQRGAVEHQVIKGKAGIYYFKGGNLDGQRARLLLFDRIKMEGQQLSPPVHVDVRELAQQEGFEGMVVHHLGEEQIVAELKFGSHWVPALIDREGPELSMNCLWIDPDDSSEVGRARDEAYRRAMVLMSLRRAISTQVRLGLPFDEPRTERGQQDGKLRARFEKAYFGGKKSYTFNGDSYSVYNKRGEAMAPQVCIDFVTESVERASGMHFAGRSDRAQKVLGALNFDEILGGFRRKEMALRNYARLNPHRLQLLDVPQKHWVRYEQIDRFFNFVESNKEDLRAGDIVIIRGRAAWDRYKEVHTHTFFVYESDPVTGMPTLLAGNSGKPRIVSWDSEMIRAPKRSIRHRIRPNMEWLYDHVVLRTPLRGERWAAPLSLGAQ